MEGTPHAPVTDLSPTAPNFPQFRDSPDAQLRCDSVWGQRFGTKLSRPSVSLLRMPPLPLPMEIIILHSQHSFSS